MLKTNRSIVVTAVLLALLVVAQAITLLRAYHGESLIAGGKTGALFSIQLVNGQVYYGRFEQADSHSVKLTKPYMVTLGAANSAGTRETNLVNMQKAEASAPDWISVPLDKILLIEAVGTDSRIAKLIDNDAK